MAVRPRHGLSLCAGGGGLDLGLMLAEPGFHTRAFVEWEEYPRSVLIAGQRAGYFAPAPIWDDVTTFDARPFRGAFDTILAGYPCQPFSQAGQRKGTDDERHLWPDVARIICEVDPEWVFLENVAGHVSLGLETVLRNLWDMDFTPAVGLFTAAETGAPHERERVFIVAHRQGPDWWGEQQAGRTRSGGGGPSGSGAELADPGDTGFPRAGCLSQYCGEVVQPCHNRGEEMEHATGLGRGKGRAEPEVRSGRNSPASAGGAMADAEGPDGGGEQPAGRTGCRWPGPSGDGAELAHTGQPRLEGREWRGTPDERHGAAAHGSAAERGRPCLFPPGPGDGAAWSAVIGMAPGLAPSVSFGDIARRAQELVALAEQGELAQAAAESELRLMVDGMASRSRALRLLGNGVHPLAAAHAWRTLAAAHGLRPVDMDAASGDGCTANPDDFDLEAAE